MNKLILTISAVAVSSLLTVHTASADLQGISIDAIDSGLGIGTTYRVYADVLTGDQLDAVFGDAVDPLSIGTTTSFYQNMFGGYSAPSAALFGFFPSLEFDSFVTIGLLDDTGNAMLDIGIDWAPFEAGGDILTNNGTWFATPADAQVMEIGGRVLIGQFTTTGDISGVVSLQGKNADLSNWQNRSVAFDSAAVPAPGAIALLGLAGLATRRRRK